MEYIKHIEGNLYDIRNIDNLEEVETLLSEGFYPSESEEKPTIDENYILGDYLTFDEEKLVWVHHWVKELNIRYINSKINSLKQQLANTDYKVVKNMEYQMAMMSSVEPNQIILDLYDPQELHNERQALRDKINELEQLLKGE